MTTPVIIDVAIVVVLGLFCLMGIRRGLLRSLAGLVTTVMALVGAALIAATFTGPVTQLVSPMIEAQVEKKLDAALGQRRRPGRTRIVKQKTCWPFWAWMRRSGSLWRKR